MNSDQNRTRFAAGRATRRPRSQTGGAGLAAAVLAAAVLVGSALIAVPAQAAAVAADRQAESGHLLAVTANNSPDGMVENFQLSTDDLRAGLVRVQLHNVGTVTHQVQLVRLHAGVTAAAYRAALLATQGGATLMLADATGGSGAIDPGGRQTTYVNLRAGNYVALCFQAGGDGGAPHFVHGMFAAFEVRGHDEQDVPSGHILGTVKAFTEGQKMGFDMSSAIDGDGLYRFSNTAPMDTHEFNLLKLATGKTAQDFLAWATHGMVGPPPVSGAFGGGQALAPGGELWVRMHLPPGNYVAVCFVPDEAPPHLPHAALGMVQGFRVNK